MLKAKWKNEKAVAKEEAMVRNYRKRNNDKEYVAR
jgi:hypothetical protein